jgi:hypothetical protein
MDGLPPQYILISNRVMVSLTGELENIITAQTKLKHITNCGEQNTFDLKY